MIRKEYQIDPMGRRGAHTWRKMRINALPGTAAHAALDAVTRFNASALIQEMATNTKFRELLWGFGLGSTYMRPFVHLWPAEVSVGSVEVCASKGSSIPQDCRVPTHSYPHSLSAGSEERESSACTCCASRTTRRK